MYYIHPQRTETDAANPPAEDRNRGHKNAPMGGGGATHIGGDMG